MSKDEKKGQKSKLFKQYDEGTLKALKKNIKKPLPVPLDDDQILKISAEAGALQVEIEALEEALKKEKAKRQTVIDEKDDKLRALLHQQESRTREEEVVCVELPDYAANQVEIVRTDDGTIVDVRTMIASERTGDMFGGKGEGKKN